MKTRRLLLLGAAALGLAATPSAAFAGAGEGVGYRLTNEPGSTLSGGFIQLPASPGATVTARFIASNTTRQAVNVVFYGADGQTTRATGAVFGSSSPTAAGSWLTPSRTSATLPSNSELPITVSVRVPAGTSVGDHVAAVIMEQQENASTATVKQVVRYAIPLLIDIAGGAGPQIELGSARLTHIPGTDVPAAILPMRNTGSRVCRPVVVARVAGDNGAPVTIERQLAEILPGDKISYPLRMSTGMSPGNYLVRADVTGCGLSVGTSTSATLESSDQQSAPDASGAGGAGADGSSGGSNTITPVPLKRTGTGSGGGDDGGKDRTRAQGQADDPGGSGSSTGEDQEAATPVVPPKGPKGRSWLRRAGDTIAEQAPKVLEKASIPLGAAALIGLLFFFQNALDRRDPKLAGAPRERDAALGFDPNPLHS